jgi:hypothetical protein
MGGGQTGAPADDDHVPCHDPWRGHRDLAFHGAGRPVWAGPDPGAGAGRGPEPERAEAQIRPERPTGRGRDEAAGGWGRS